MKFRPKDIIAIVSLIIGAALKLKGVDSQVDLAMALILGYYFAHRLDGIDKGI